MILKDYQADALKNLEDFLRLLDENKSIGKAFRNFWALRDVHAEPYQNNIAHVPQVCFKVPTGGGKTFMAAASLKIIFDALYMQSKIVVWLVPSETILTQTYKNLSDATHPYHKKLATDFGGRIAFYTKEQLLAGENFSPTAVAEQLSILVLSYDSFRTNNKDGRKAYQQNGQLNQFASLIADDELLRGADESSLIQVIRHYKPVVIVDESHHAKTPLSVDMLKNFNPSFILELTATPRNTSNVIAYAPAAKLKRNGMVKLPVIVYNRPTQGDVISDAIKFRNELEIFGHAEKIRPIILFQAETQGRGNRATFDKIKNELIKEHGVSPEQIAIKTAEINDLKNVDLTAADCKIRYIITINALKEGWDCPFAYILASLANRTSVVDVEQILGRILRRPFTKNFPAEILNRSYVFTSSAEFQQTLNKIIDGLNASGFSGQEYRVAADDESSTEIEAIISPENFSNPDIRAKEERMRMREFKMREKYFADASKLVLPKFFIVEDIGGLFGGTQEILLSKDNLNKNFTLADKDIIINFDNLRREIVAFDVQDDEDFPSCEFLSDDKIKNFFEIFDNLAPASQIRECAKKIADAVDKRKNIPSTQEIFDYVKRIVETFDRDRLRDAIINTSAYVKKISDKIDLMQAVHAQKNFLKLIDARKIFAKPEYKLPATIAPVKFQRWNNSLYKAEEETLNKLELRIIAALTASNKILWWHRNRSQKDFCLNGFINHYPDFIVRMKSGITFLVETKGEHLGNLESKLKLDLGKIWESKAGSDSFGYFMVFDSNPIDGAIDLDDFTARLSAS